jgi:hypothetical protein
VLQLLDNCYAVCRYVEQRSADGRKQTLAAAKAYRDLIQQQDGTGQKGGIREQRGSMLPFVFQKARRG